LESGCKSTNFFPYDKIFFKEKSQLTDYKHLFFLSEGLPTSQNHIFQALRNAFLPPEDVRLLGHWS
jgi:hypothetical protein